MSVRIRMKGETKKETENRTKQNKMKLKSAHRGHCKNKTWQ